MCDEVSRHQRPPAEHVGVPARRLLADSGDGDPDTGADLDGPVFLERRVAEGLREQPPAGRVAVGVPHDEDARRPVGRYGVVPRRLEEAGANLVDLGKRPDICDGHLLGGDAHDGSIFLVQAVDVEHAAAADDFVLEDQMGEPGVPGARDGGERTAQGVDEGGTQQNRGGEATSKGQGQHDCGQGVSVLFARQVYMSNGASSRYKPG